MCEQRIRAITWLVLANHQEGDIVIRLVWIKDVAQDLVGYAIESKDIASGSTIGEYETPTRAHAWALYERECDRAKKTSPASRIER